MELTRSKSNSPRIEAIQIHRVTGEAEVWHGPAGARCVGSPGRDFLPVALGGASTRAAESALIEAEFLVVSADNGEQGIFGPISPSISPQILSRLNSILIGRRVFAYEDCWEAVFTGERHGRSGHYITALGAVDCALWDLRGQLLGLSVFELLGGPTRKAVSCYASLLGYEANSDEAEALAVKIGEMGFIGQKWALRDGPNEGEAGLTRNVARVARLRQAVGKHHLLMFDALGKWTPAYAQAVLRAIQPYNIAYIEEPVGPAESAAYRRLSQMKLAPIAAGEHLYTRFEVLRFLEAPWLDLLQPDVAWCGGLTEAAKITTLASTLGVPVFPHGASFIPALHLAMSCSPGTVPAVEYHLTIEPKRQFFLLPKFQPQDGKISLPEVPGLGIALDTARVISRTCVTPA